MSYKTTITHIADADNAYEVTYEDSFTKRVSEATLTDVGGHATLLWNSSGNAVPEDIMEGSGWTEEAIAEHAAGSTIKAREAIKRYILGRKNMSAEARAEEAYERRANFKPGETVVNVLTGERWTV
jgi:hypothetical protein